MRKIIALIVLTSALSGCAWFQKLQDDPIAALQDGTGYIRTALSLAQTAFEIWASADPAQAVEVRPRFNQVIHEVDRGLIVAQDGLRLAATARGPAPDAATLLRDAQTAMGHLHDFLAGLHGSPPATGGLPSGAGEITPATAALRTALDATERASRTVRY